MGLKDQASRLQGAGRRKKMSKKVVMNSNFLKSHTYHGGVLEIDRLPILEAVVWRSEDNNGDAEHHEMETSMF